MTNDIHVQFSNLNAEDVIIQLPVMVRTQYDWQMSIEPLLEAVSRWASNDERLIAVGLCGSYANGKAHQNSDVDLVIVSLDPSYFLSHRNWLSQFGEPEIIEREDYNLVQSIRVFYRDSHEVEFGFTERGWCIPPIDCGTAAVITSGLRIIYDPEQNLAKAIRWVSDHPTYR